MDIIYSWSTEFAGLESLPSDIYANYSKLVEIVEAVNTIVSDMSLLKMKNLSNKSTDVHLTEMNDLVCIPLFIHMSTCEKVDL